MDTRTIDQFEPALTAIGDELALRAETLAQKSTECTLTTAEREEYSDVVRLNDLLSEVKL